MHGNTTRRIVVGGEGHLLHIFSEGLHIFDIIVDSFVVEELTKNWHFAVWTNALHCLVKMTAKFFGKAVDKPFSVTGNKDNMLIMIMIVFVELCMIS